MDAFGRHCRYWVIGLLISLICINLYGFDNSGSKKNGVPEYLVKVSSYYPERGQFFTMDIGIFYEDLGSISFELPEFPENLLPVEVKAMPAPVFRFGDFKSLKPRDEILVYSIVFIALKEGRIRLDPAKLKYPGGELEIPIPVLNCIPPQKELQPVLSWKNLPSVFDEGKAFQLSVETDFIPSLNVSVEYELSPDFFIEELPLDPENPLEIKNFSLIPLTSGKADLPVVKYIWSDDDFEYSVVLGKKTVEVRKNRALPDSGEKNAAAAWPPESYGEIVVEDFAKKEIQEKSSGNESNGIKPLKKIQKTAGLNFVRIPFGVGVFIFVTGIILFFSGIILLRYKKVHSRGILALLIVLGFFMAAGSLFIRSGVYGVSRVPELYYIPDNLSSVRQNIEMDSEVKILEDAGNWLFVRTSTGIEGWIKKEDVSGIKKFW